jgi:uncharacterized protein YrrD
MRLGKDLVDKPIITVNDGRHMGKVKDVYLDKDLTMMTGIFLGREGWVRRKDNYIPTTSVVVFGVDAILIENAEAITDSQTTKIEGWLKLSELVGRDIDTPGGTRLGTVGDVILDTEGRILGFSLGRVLVDGPIAQQRAIRRDVLIDNGNEDGAMTIDLLRAERLPIGTAVSEPETASNNNDSEASADATNA